MEYKVSLMPSGVEFLAAHDESLLDAALKANVILSYSCRDGRCGACKVKVVDGEVNQPNGQTGMSKDDYQDGFALACVAIPLTDIVLEATFHPELQGMKRKVQPTKVDSIDFPVADVAVLKLRFPPEANFEYLPGQYVELIYRGARRSYSIANILKAYDGIELHIKKNPGGLFSEFIFSELKLNQLIYVDGALGTFFVRESDRPIVFIAGGTGFAPVKSMVEKLLFEYNKKQIHIYWGMSRSADFYSGLPIKWESDHENVRYVPVVSDDDNDWRGRSGLVHKAVLEDFEGMSLLDVYACGSPLMIKAAEHDFACEGMDMNHFYSDTFMPSNKLVNRKCKGFE
ncbi:MAG: 2Fe-2S iron-sulfur cluster binding domain-containing protein [Ectothiorhodospiraceae bacterium]|nr:2Fe-2S iron-sulfur cluster binding domain-containing protein [Ectothiorhodospiraceae bacterium]